MSDSAAETGLLRDLLIQVDRVGIQAHGGIHLNVGFGDRLRQRRCLPDEQILEKKAGGHTGASPNPLLFMMASKHRIKPHLRGWTVT